MPYIRVRDAHIRKLSDAKLSPDLYGHAALEAIKYLYLEKWCDAVDSAKTADDFSNVAMLQDIDRTIAELGKYRQSAQEVFSPTVDPRYISAEMTLEDA